MGYTLLPMAIPMDNTACAEHTLCSLPMDVHTFPAHYPEGL